MNNAQYRDDSNSSLKICVDIDNVLSQTDSVMRNLIFAYTNGRVRLRYEDVRYFEYHRCCDSDGNSITRNEWEAIHDLFSARECILSIPAIEGASQVMRRLSETHEITIVTSRQRNAITATVEWLRKNNLPYCRLEFAEHRKKHLFAGFHVAVEDDYQQAVCFAEVGVRCLLIRHPWNTNRPHVNGIQWVYTWSEVEQHLDPYPK